MADARPIAVFDSGLGGLSVVRRLRELLPAESVVYFGDTARVPYGSKSRRTVSTFAAQDARFLLQFSPKLMVVACNTASSLALPDIERTVPLPVIGMLEPGAEAAVRASRSGPIAVLGTEATVSSGAYIEAIRRIAPGAIVRQRPCPLFVPLVEEGRGPSDPVVLTVAREYLSGLEDAAVVVLGCTHYPLLAPAIATICGDGVTIIDSGAEASRAVAERLSQAGALAVGTSRGGLHCFVSDNPDRFRAVGSRFLLEELNRVEFVEPERYIL